MLNENAKAWVAALRSGEYMRWQGIINAFEVMFFIGIAIWLCWL